MSLPSAFHIRIPFESMVYVLFVLAFSTSLSFDESISREAPSAFLSQLLTMTFFTVPSAEVIT